MSVFFSRTTGNQIVMHNSINGPESIKAGFVLVSSDLHKAFLAHASCHRCSV